MTYSNNSDNWYIAYTHNRCEKKVNQKARELGLESYLPLQLQVRQWSDRIKKIEVPLFPNYIFLKSDVERIYQFRQIKEIVNLVYFNKKLATIKASQIDTIKKLLKEKSNIITEPRLYKIGSKVKIKQGPFVGVEGLLVKKNNQNRFLIQIETLGQSIFVDVPPSYLSYH